MLAGIAPPHWTEQRVLSFADNESMNHNFHEMLGLTASAHDTTQAENHATGIYVNHDKFAKIRVP